MNFWARRWAKHGRLGGERKLNGSPVAETNCTAMERQPLAHDVSGPLIVPPV